MDLRAAARDPWVWGQIVLIGLVALLAPLLPRFVSLGDVDFTFNRVDPTWIRALATLPLAAAWRLRSGGRAPSARA